MVRSISVTGFNFTTHCIMVIYETIKYGSASSNLSYSPKGFFNLIIPTLFDQLILLKEEFLIAQLFFFSVSGFNNVLWIWIQREGCHLLQMLAKTTHGEVFCCADENCVREMIGKSEDVLTLMCKTDCNSCKLIKQK